MSDYKLISPLLDGFVMGDPISVHNGVACCPAMRENTDEKYIVKVVSVPASQKELDALLLARAYPDAASATVYFKAQAEEVIKEAELLQQLSRMEGFLPYSGCQIVPMESNDLGYQVYLISPYKRSLEKHMRRTAMTHLGAVNLGLDLCAALAICRRSGYLYVAGKPTNVFLVNEREYRIGDLGFVPLGSLKYSNLPTKYCSCYSPPELHDSFNTLNPTADTYAVGMMLYRIYNDGVLPFTDKAPLRSLPAPAHADEEMAEIILKAIAPNPRNRYQSPIEMGKALVSYMQRNIVNDVPISGPAAYSEQEVPQENAPAAQMPALDIESARQPETAPVEEEVTEASPETEMGETEEVPEDVTIDQENLDILPDEDTQPDDMDDLLSAANKLLESDDYDTDEEDETVSEEAPDEEAEEASSQPEADESDSAAEADDTVSGDIDDDFDDNFDDDDDDDDYDEPVKEPAAASADGKKKKNPLGGIIAIVLAAALVFGGYYFYKNYFLLPIDSMNISTQEDTMTVEIRSQIDESMLSVICTDTYGNTFTQKVEGGKAVFTGLNADTLYKVTADVSGFHKLTGAYFGSCTTAAQTKILSFDAKTGTEDGSAILTFVVEGAKSHDWVIEYSTPGEETRSVSLNGHMVSITGLTVGSEYTFKLLPASNAEQYIVGENSLQFTASKAVIARDLTIVSCENNVLTAQWSVSADTPVEKWIVRCYSENGYDRSLEVNEPTARFSDISPNTAYTVEVTAEGMSQNARAFVSANPTTITEISVTDSAADGLTVDWTYDGETPEGGWLLIYSVDGSEASDVVKSDSGSAVIRTWIPGSTYDLTIQAVDGSTVFGGRYEYQVPAAQPFDQYSFQPAKLQTSLCNTPSGEGWTYKDINTEDYTTSFKVGDSVSIVLRSEVSFYLPSDQTKVQFVIRDSEGKAIAGLVRTETKGWNTMWNGRTCVLTVPALPTQSGSYSVSVYFNGGAVMTSDFTLAK